MPGETAYKIAAALCQSEVAQVVSRREARSSNGRSGCAASLNSDFGLIKFPCIEDPVANPATIRQDLV